MASEILDIIQNITINANTDAVAVLNKEFGTSIKQVQTLESEIDALGKQIESTSKDDATQLKVLNKLLEDRKKKIDDITASIAKQIGASDKLSNASKKLTTNLTGVSTGFSNIVRDAPFGIIGIGNNITQVFDAITLSAGKLKAEGASTKQIFGAIGGSLFTLNTALSLGVTLLTVFGDKLFNTADAADEAKDAYDDFIKSLNQAVKTSIVNTDQQVQDLERARGIILSNGKASKLTFDQLKRDYPVLLKNIKDENALRANPQVFDEISKQIKAREQSNALNKTAALVAEQERNAKKALQVVEAQLAGAIENEAKARERLRRFPSELQIQAVEDAVAGRQRLEIQRDNAKAFIKALQETRRQQTAESIKQANIAADLIFKEDTKREKKIRKQRQQREKTNATPLSTDSTPIDDLTKLPKSIKVRQDLEDKALDDFLTRIRVQEKAQEDLEKRRRGAEKAAIAGVRRLIDVYQELQDAQLEGIDREISTRERNLDRFTVLAEQGQTDLFLAEQQRLNDLQAERERVAQRQLQINALILASEQAIAVAQAIGAITAAAAKGDPYTIALRIAAAVTAFIGGVAAIKGAFKDGVVDFNGSGTGTSDSNLVRISNGESVITADATKRYKTELAAMNAGTYKPVIASVGGGNRVEMESMRAQMDQLIANTSSDRVSVNTNFNENGVSQYVARAQKRLRNRYK